MCRINWAIFILNFILNIFPNCGKFGIYQAKTWKGFFTHVSSDVRFQILLGEKSFGAGSRFFWSSRSWLGHNQFYIALPLSFKFFQSFKISRSWLVNDQIYMDILHQILWYGYRFNSTWPSRLRKKLGPFSTFHHSANIDHFIFEILKSIVQSFLTWRNLIRFFVSVTNTKDKDFSSFVKRLFDSLVSIDSFATPRSSWKATEQAAVDFILWQCNFLRILFKFC